MSGNSQRANNSFNHYHHANIKPQPGYPGVHAYTSQNPNTYQMPQHYPQEMNYMYPNIGNNLLNNMSSFMPPPPPPMDNSYGASKRPASNEDFRVYEELMTHKKKPNKGFDSMAPSSISGAADYSIDYKKRSSDRMEEIHPGDYSIYLY